MVFQFEVEELRVILVAQPLSHVCVIDTHGKLHNQYWLPGA
jgi:hypothetical protein